MINAATWAIVLAGGDGVRLRSLTTAPNGQYVPKQYCSLFGGSSLIHEAIRRALSFSSPEQVCAVVSEQHRQWWQKSLWPLTEANIVVQPQNKGTAHGILLPLLHILDCDPEAEVVVLPSDHHLEDEQALRKSIQFALSSVRTYPQNIMLMGMEPEEADPELGYIVPDKTSEVCLQPRSVAKFAEKPCVDVARKLVEEGALWNTFIMVARAATLLQLFMEKHPIAVLRMKISLFHQLQDKTAISDFYTTLQEVDFSRHILSGMENRLRVVKVPKCGWTDLGTPQRVMQTLFKTPQRKILTTSGHMHLNLALQYERQTQAGTEIVA